MIAAAMARDAAMGHACAQSFLRGARSAPCRVRGWAAARLAHRDRAHLWGSPPGRSAAYVVWPRACCVKVKLYPKPAMQIERNQDSPH